MLDEEPIAGAGQPDGNSEANAGPGTPPAPNDRADAYEPDADEPDAAPVLEPGAQTAAPLETLEPPEAPEALTSPAPPAPSQRRFPRSRLVLAFGAVVVVAVIAAGGAFVAMPQRTATPPPTASASVATPAVPTATPTAAPPSPSEPEPTPTPDPTEIVLSPDAGRVAFEDDFTGTNAGWPTSSTGLTTLSMGKGVYVVGGKAASTDHLVEAPYEPRVQQIAVTATATQSAGQGTAGFGVTCGSMSTPAAEPSLPAEASAQASPVDGREILFEFVVLNNGGWLIARRDGPPARSVEPVVLMHGTSAVVPGARPLTVSGICASAPGGTRTRLILTIDGLKVMDFSDVSATVTDGWRGGLVVSTVDVKTSVAFRHVEIRDLSAQ